MNAEYQKLVDKLSKLALEANAVAIQIERLEQTTSDGKPKDGQEYWYFDSRLVSGNSNWNNFNADNERWKAGNAYLTLQEVETAREFKLAVVRINREIDRLNKLERWFADWGSVSQFKYFPITVAGCFVSSWAVLNVFNFTFKYGSKQTLESVLASHATDFDIVQKCGAA